MQNNYVWIIVVSVLLILMLFFNKKVRLFDLIKEQIQVLKNAKTNKISFWDCICFWIFPLVVALILVFKLDFIVNNDLADTLTTVFSIIFTVLFGFAAIMIGKIDSENKTEKQVAEETFVSIVSSNILSFVAIVFSIVVSQFENTVCLQIFSLLLLTVSLMIIMLVLMITKRTFVLFVKHKGK